MWAVNGHSVLIGETISNRLMHLFGLSTRVIDDAWVTARMSFTVCSSKTYVRSFCLETSPAMSLSLEVGRRILACLRQQAGYTRLYDRQGNRTGKSSLHLGERLTWLTLVPFYLGVGSTINQVPSMEYHPLQRDNRIQPSRGT
jgi:hypothetical protein